MRRLILVGLDACTSAPREATLHPPPDDPVAPPTRAALLGVEDGDGPLAGSIAALGGELGPCFHAARVCIVRFPTRDRLPLAALRALPGVRYAEVDALMSSPIRPRTWTDPAPSAACTDPWEMTAIGAAAAWNTLGDQGTLSPVVSIMDSGFNSTHRDVARAVWGGWDYGNGDADPEIEFAAGVPAHGTFIAGVIAGADDGVGRTGVAPAGRLNLQKIADNNGALYFSYAVAALADAAQGDLGIRVINYSIASSATSAAFDDAVAALADADILLVAAAGNCSSAGCADADNDVYPLYPASYDHDHVLTVAGHLRDGSLNPYSHYGADSVDLAAPGVDLCGPGAYGDEDWYVSGGTSYATPLVAGTAALVWGRWPRLRASEVARALRASAIDLPALAGRVRSGGRLSTARAVDVAVPRLERPADRAVDRYGQLDIYIDNVGAAGAATVVLTHPHAIEIVRVDLPGWTATHAAPGEVIDLPDAGAHAADRAISLLRGPLPADAPLRLPVVIRAWSVDSHPITTRLVATSPGTDGWLNAPYAAGEDDETGFLAWTSWVDAIAAVPSTTLTLEVGELSAGAPLDLTVTGAAPQALVTWVMGRGPDNGPCLPLDPVRCLHLSQPVRVGASRADPLGQAHLRLRAPSPLPGFQPWFQAVVASVDPEWSDAVAPTAP